MRYKNEKGNWAKIDNTVIPAPSADKSSYAFKNKGNNVEVLMSDTLDKDNAISVNFKDYSVSFKPLNLQKAKSKSEVAFIQTGKSQTKDSSLNAAKSYQSIEYAKTFDEKTSIRITPITTGVKEEIILNEIPEQEEFAYEITVKNSVPKLRADGNVWFVDEENNKLVGSFAAPFMYDSSDEERFSYDIKVKLEQISANKYKYTMIPDRAFLENPDISYPVVIDPSYTFELTKSADTFIAQKYPLNSYTNDIHMKIGNSAEFQKSRGLVKFIDVGTTIGADKTILSAKFRAYQDYTGASAPSIGLYEVTTSFDTNTVNWNTTLNYAQSPAATQTVSAVGWYEWNVTNLVKAWYNSPQQYNSIAIRNVDENANMYKRFRSEEYSNDYAPELVVNYLQNPTITGSGYGNGTNSGTGYVNLSWNAVQGATGYKIKLFNGKDYESFDVGNVTSWTSKNKKIWPTPAEISSGRYTLHHDNLGTELANDPVGVYINAASGYHIHHKYFIRVTAYDAQGETYTYSNGIFPELPDTTRPPQPVSFTAASFFSGPTGEILVDWSDVTDLPDTIASGIKNYTVEYSTDGGSTWQGSQTVIDSQYTYQNMPENTDYLFRVKATDHQNNFSDWKQSGLQTGDYSGPNAPTSFTVTPAAWTKNITPTISWSGITDSGNNLSRVQYMVKTGGTTVIDWTDIDGTGISGYPASGTFTLDSQTFQNLAGGQHTVYIRGVDVSQNVGAESSKIYYKDITKPIAVISQPANGASITGTQNITATISKNDNLSNLKQWVLEYGEGTNPSTFNTLKTGTAEVANQVIYSWDTNALTIGDTYTLRIRVTDLAENEEIKTVSVVKKFEDLVIGGILRYKSGASDDIKALQARLHYLGLKIGDNSTPDGDFGEKTLSAVVALQLNAGLLADGKVGPQTIGQINSYVRNVDGTLRYNLDKIQTDILKYANNGTYSQNGVKYLQTLLQGYIKFVLGPVGADRIDGIYGEYTASAVKAIQKFSGYGFTSLPVTGAIDEATWDKLYDLLVLNDPAAYETLKDDQTQILQGPSDITIKSKSSSSITWIVKNAKGKIFKVFDSNNDVCQTKELAENVCEVITENLNPGTSYRAVIYNNGTPEDYQYATTEGTIIPPSNVYFSYFDAFTNTQQTNNIHLYGNAPGANSIQIRIINIAGNVVYYHNYWGPYLNDILTLNTVGVYKVEAFVDNEATAKQYRYLQIVSADGHNPYDLVEGIKQGVFDTVATLVDIIKHPLNTIEAAIFLIIATQNPSSPQGVQLQETITILASQAWDDIIAGDLYEKGKLVGNIFGEIALGVIADKGISVSIKAIKAVAQSGKLVSWIGKVKTGTMTSSAVKTSIKTVAEAISSAKSMATSFRSRIASGLFKKLDGVTKWETATVSSVVDTTNPSIVGNAGSKIYEYNPSILDNAIVKGSQVEYINYYKHLLTDAGIDEIVAANPAKFAGKDISAIKTEMGKLRAKIQNAKDMAEDFALAHPGANMTAIDGSYSFEWWPVENCAEIWAARDAILQGAKLENLAIRSIDYGTGAFKDYCTNCVNTFVDLIKVAD